MANISPPILLLGSLLVVPVSGALAQNNNPDNVGGTSGSKIAQPNYPPGTGRDPALTSGELPKAKAAGVPADKNPNVAGATGHTIVKGTSSTVVGDKKAYVKRKTGP